MFPYTIYTKCNQESLNKCYSKYLSTIDNNRYNILLFGVFPNVNDPFFRVNKQQFDNHSLITNHDDYTFISHYWISNTYYSPSIKPLDNYRCLYADFNRDIFYNTLIENEYSELFDVIMIDSFMLCHLKDNNYIDVINIMVKFIKNNGSLYFRQSDKQYVQQYDWNDINMFTNVHVTIDYNSKTLKDSNIVDYYCNDKFNIEISFRPCD